VIIPLTIKGSFNDWVVSTPVGGTAVKSGTLSAPSVTFTPATGTTGAVTFTVTAKGTVVDSAPVTAKVTVGNAILKIEPDPYPQQTTPFGAAIVLPLTVTGSYDDLVISTPSVGTAVKSGSLAAPSVTYTPTSASAGIDSFTVQAKVNGTATVSNTVTISVKIAPVIDPVAAQSASYNVPKTIPLTVKGKWDSLATSGLQNGTATVSPVQGSPSVIFIPNNACATTAGLSVSASGPGGVSSLVPITINVAAPPPQPVGPVTTPFNTPITIPLTIPCGSWTSLTISNVVGGTATVAGTQTAPAVTFTPTTGFVGSASFTVTPVGSGAALTAIPVSVTVSPPPMPVIAAIGAKVATYNTPITVPLSIGGTWLTLATTSVTGGTVTVSNAQSAPSVTFTPTTGSFAAGGFTVTANGPGTVSNAVAVSVKIKAPDGTLNVPYNGAGVFTSIPAPQIVTQPANGSAVVLSVNPFPAVSVIYTPTTGYSGNDSFTYKVLATSGTSEPGTVSVTVGAAPKPVITAVTDKTTPYNTAIVIPLTITNPWQSITASSVSGGTVVSSGTQAAPSVTFTPTNGTTGLKTFSLTASGAGGVSDPVLVKVTVASPLPPAPVISQVAAQTTASNTPITIPLTISGQWYFVSATGAANGTGAGSGYSSTPSVTFTPTSGATGPASVTVTATGPGGVSLPVTISVTITPLVAPNVTLNVAYNTPGSFTTPSPATVVTQPLHGQASPVSSIYTGNLMIYSPASGYSGPDSFTYTYAGRSPGTVSVTVAAPPPPPPPVINPIPAKTTAYNTPITVPLSITGQWASITPYLVYNGTAYASGSSVVFTPNAGYSGGGGGFWVYATGPGGYSAPTSAVITVSPPAPVPSGSMSVSPTTCTIPAGQTMCSVQVTWSTTNSPTACVWKTAPNSVQLWACNPSGSSTWPYTFAGTTSFELRAHTSQPTAGSNAERLAGTLLATASATGVVAPPTNLTANVSSTYWSWYRWFGGGLYKDPAIVVSAFGGSGIYTYTWEKISGDNQAINVSGNTATWDGPTYSGSTLSSVWRCKVTDSAGNVAYTPSVSVTASYENLQ
jgi:hypothetical protein